MYVAKSVVIKKKYISYRKILYRIHAPLDAIIKKFKNSLCKDLAQLLAKRPQEQILIIIAYAMILSTRACKGVAPHHIL
jgi:hypothetical protein